MKKGEITGLSQKAEDTKIPIEHEVRKLHREGCAWILR